MVSVWSLAAKKTNTKLCFGTKGAISHAPSGEQSCQIVCPSASMCAQHAMNTLLVSDPIHDCGDELVGKGSSTGCS